MKKLTLPNPSEVAGIRVLTKAPRDPFKKSRIRPLVHFPLELTLPKPVVIPPIKHHGRGRPSDLNTEIARRILAVACTSAPLHVIASAGGVDRDTLRSWLTRDDHEGYQVFKAAFAAAQTYAYLTALKSIMEGMHADPKVAFEFLARRFPEDWGKVPGQDGESGKSDLTVYNLPGVKGDLGSMLERIFTRLTNGAKGNGPLSLEAGADGVHRPKDPRPPKEKK
jgi:hypothetical protein